MPSELNTYSNNYKIGCPFFREQHKNEIKCEGMCEGQRYTLLKFNSEEDKLNQIDSFCLGNQFYKTCPVAICVLEKYELQGD